MIEVIRRPAILRAQGSPPKIIEEFVGRVNSGTAGVSIARMKSPPGWAEPGQTGQFDEYTLVLEGMLRVETETGTSEIRAGEAIIVGRGEWVRYSTPSLDGAVYIAVCVPAFSAEAVDREGGIK